MRSDHWLLFDADRRVTGCRCGFVADIESDCGWGDSVVKHLVDLNRDALRQISFAYTHPGSDDPEDRMFEIAQAALAETSPSPMRRDDEVIEVLPDGRKRLRARIEGAE